MTLREYIEREIGERGPIPFSRYMELCLYGAPGGDPPGYYSRAREQFGKAGDFYTSSDVHAVFGRLLARQFDEMWRVLESPPRIDLVELGPGRGLFAQDVLDWTAKKFPEFHRALHATLVEGSPGLRARLEERFAAQIAAGKVRVVETVEQAKIEGEFIVFANEFFDALPVEVIADRGELRIGVENGRFVESFAPPSTAEMDFLDRYSVHPEAGERVEATLVSLDHLRRIAAAPAAGARGFCLLVDYGYTRQEQLAGRHRDTVMAFRQHTISQNPYEAPGEQDITAHVNFTALMDVGKQVGLEPLALVTQSQLLMGIGEDNQFADAFEDCRLPQERAKVALQLKHLATPVGMGDAFQALVLGRGVAKEKARELSGLKFAR
ncbi:MAG: SAM-dependent methyltransferase [Terriglobales bacterium]